MLIYLFKNMNDSDQYINIEKYIQKLNSITEHENTLEEKEIYPFLKVNLSCLGEYFYSNYKENNLKSRLIIQVHDELVVEVEKSELEKVKK